MNIGERVKTLRKDMLNLTADKFGAKLGIQKSAVSKIERGENNLSETLLLSICREFGVNEKWLRTGEGEPFIEKSKDQQIQEMVDEIMATKPEDFRRRFVHALTLLDADGWKALEKFIDSISEANKEEPHTVAAPRDSSDLTPEEQELVRQLREKKQRADA